MKNVYISSSVLGEGGITRYEVTAQNEWVKKGFYPIGASPVFTIAGNTCYAVIRETTPDENSKIKMMQIAPDGRLGDVVEEYDTMGHRANHVLIDGERNHIFATNFGSGSLFCTPKELLVFTGTSVHPEKQNQAHTHCIELSPDGKYYIVADLGADELYVLDFDLNVVSKEKMPAGHGPRQFKYSDDGRYLYVMSEISSHIEVVSYEEGKLTYVASYPCLPEDYKEYSAAGEIRKAGDFLFTANRGHSSICVHHILPEGKLERVGIFSSIGTLPRNLLVMDDELVVLCEVSQDVHFMKIMPDGSLVATEKTFETPKPACIGVFETEESV